MEEECIVLDSFGLIPNFSLYLNEGINFPISCPGEITVGKFPALTVKLDHYSICNHHATIFTKYNELSNEWEVFIRDHNSLNGTYVGPALSELDKCIGDHKVNPGDIICFGSFEQIFKLVSAISPAEYPFMSGGMFGYDSVESFSELPTFKFSPKISRAFSEDSGRTDSWSVSSGESIKLPEISPKTPSSMKRKLIKR